MSGTATSSERRSMDPIVEALMRTGEPPNVRSMPKCPVCGEECETYYTDYYGTVVGCENCIDTKDAEDDDG